MFGFGYNAPFIDVTIATQLSTDLNEHEMAVLTSLATLVDLDAGEIFAAQDSVGREAVIVVKGTASVVRNGELIAEVGPGAVLGEGALLTGERRNATLMTATPMTLAVLGPREFASFLDRCPRVSREVNALAELRSS